MSNLVGREVKVQANLFGLYPVYLTGVIKRERDGKLVRVAIGNDRGRVERVEIVGSCVHHDRPYRWPK